MIRNLIGSLVVALAALVAPSAAVGIWTEGHGDIGLAYEEGSLDLHFHLEDAIVNGVPIVDEEFEPEEIVVIVPDSTIPRPSGSDWDFAGNSAGAPLWYIDQSLLADRPWPGVATEELSSDDFAEVSLTLLGYSGPGDFSLITLDPLGEPTVYYQTSDGIDATDVLPLALETHAHHAWLFTAPGKYTFDLTANGTLSPLAGGGNVSDSGTFTFWVAVPEPGAVALAAIGATLMLCNGMQRRRD